jgi:hypothetical protein
MGVMLEQDVVGKMRAAANHAERPGRASPLGATVVPDAVNFGVFSRNA